MSQTVAPQREMKEGSLGQAAEPFVQEDVRSRINTAAKLYFGRLVTRTGEDTVGHPSAAIADLNVVDGVVMASRAQLDQADGDDPHYPVKETTNVLRSGYIWVAITEDVAVGDPVFVEGGAGDEGKFRASSTGAADTDVSSIAKWERGGLAADGIALLEIKLK